MNMYRLIVGTGIILLALSCSNQKNVSPQSEIVSGTPVTLTHPSSGKMEETTELNATSVFLLKTSVKASLDGYIGEVYIRIGQEVKAGEKMFEIRSKEAENIGNTVGMLDSAFRFRGQVTILSPGSGYITQLNYVKGDYVQDGETIATLSSKNSLVFLLDVPFELKPYLAMNKTVEVSLTDGQKITGILASPMPAVDLMSQTQSYIVKIPGHPELPENLIAKVKFVKKVKEQATYLPGEAILTNEIQDQFWIMKMIDSVTAVKVNIVKGIEMSDKIEIVSPSLSADDLILLSGNYGLPDTASVRIENK
jgi:hypothetical protein